MHKFHCFLRLIALSASVAAMVSSGCAPTSSAPANGADSENASEDSGLDAGADTAIAATPVVDLVVDANRDGVADLANADDQSHSAEWTPDFGASFLANLDDDDGDKLEDVLDTVVNGTDDELDLAPVTMAAWPNAPDGYVGVIQIDNPDKVRLWKKVGAQWELAAGIVNDCVPTFLSCTGENDTCADETAEAALISAAELRAGLQLAIEGRDFRRDDSWDGNVKLTMWVGIGADTNVKAIATKELADGKETVLLHVAPWILNGNLTQFDEVRAANFYPEFVADLKTALGSSGAKSKFTLYNYGNTSGKFNDQWTQDYFQTGWTSVPVGKDKIQGMRIVNARPWGRYSGSKCDVKLMPLTWLRANYLGKNKAVIAIYKTPNTGSTFDSHGNHDLLPPYENGEDKYPLGRIIHGSNILSETDDFYEAQGPQAPVLAVKTDWLIVGHIDEVLSYVPAKTARGWKLLIADNNLAKTMLQKLVDDGHGDARLFEGKNKYVGDTNDQVSAAIAVTATLDDTDLMQWSQEAQAQADAIRKAVVGALGLAESEIISMPFLTEETSGGKVAWQPGTVNLLAVGDHVEVPNPYGPKVNGVDVFAKDLQDRLATDANALGKDGTGLKVHFVDDFESYHINLGEVHCGTNPEGPAQPSMLWWMVKR